MAASVSDQLHWEARAGRVAAGAVGLGIIALILTKVLPPGARGPGAFLAAVDRAPGRLIATGILAGVTALVFGLVLAYLYRVTKFRRPELLSAALVLGAVGAVGAAVVAVARQVELVELAETFVTAGPRTEDRAEDLLTAFRSEPLLAGPGFGANIALGFATIVISVNAMRAGLLSRFMGVLGIVVGALLPLLGLGFVVIFFWLGALAALFVDRWPGGRGPAWSSGEALPWPGADQREAALGRSPTSDGEERDDADAAPESGPRDHDGDVDPPSGNGGPPARARPKRKRGRRR